MNARILVCALLLVSSPAAAQLGTPLEVAESNSKSCGEMTDHAAAPTRFATVSASALVESRSARNVTEIGADVSTRDYYENYRVLGGDEGATRNIPGHGGEMTFAFGGTGWLDFVFALDGGVERRLRDVNPVPRWATDRRLFPGRHTLEGAALYIIKFWYVDVIRERGFFAWDYSIIKAERSSFPMSEATEHWTVVRQRIGHFDVYVRIEDIDGSVCYTKLVTAPYALVSEELASMIPDAEGDLAAQASIFFESVEADRNTRILGNGLVESTKGQ